MIVLVLRWMEKMDGKYEDHNAEIIPCILSNLYLAGSLLDCLNDAIHFTEMMELNPISFFTHQIVKVKP